MPHDRGKIRNQVGLFVGVGDSKDGRSQCTVGQVLVDAFGDVFNQVSQEFKLVDQMGKVRRIDLRKLHLPHRKTPKDFF